MPCFQVPKGYVLVDILHLLVRGDPRPILRAVDSKATVGACFVEELHFYAIFAFTVARSHLH
jgi:hypothetical protein